MRREVSLEEISDGKLYDANDMVKAGCDECRDCHACCCGMGSSVVLDPLDLYRISSGLGCGFEALLAQYLELNLVDGIILPNLKMAGAEESCAFLNKEGRCSIHSCRPGICRLFPLGRYYENQSFRYFLQAGECKKEHRTKVKIRKWLDTPELKSYESFVKDWHYFLLEVQALLEKKAGEDTAQSEIRSINLYLLNQFYVKSYRTDGDFYKEFGERLTEARHQLVLG